MEGEFETLRNQSIWLLLAGLTIANPVQAGSFSDAFRNWLLGPKAQASIRPTVNLIPDGESQRCMNCHDGTAATHITVKEPGTPLQIRGFQTVNHPIGMDYDQYVARKPLEYRPRTSLNPDVNLVDGKVGCVSCHRLRDTNSAARQTVQYDLFTATVSNNWYSTAAEFYWYTATADFDWYNDEVDSHEFSTIGCLASGELAAGPRETDLCLSCHIK